MRVGLCLELQIPHACTADGRVPMTVDIYREREQTR